jgi:hypothetical protein
MVTCALLFYSRNNGLDQKGRGIAQAGFGLQEDTTCDGSHDFIQTLFWSVKYFLEAYQIYFPKDLESPQYLFGVNRNPRFTTESFSATVLRHPNLAQRAVYQFESKTDAS